jgi:hypothetical protein
MNKWVILIAVILCLGVVLGYIAGIKMQTAGHVTGQVSSDLADVLQDPQVDINDTNITDVTDDLGVII